MKRRNVLVFPCGSEVALEVFESCKHSSHFHLIGASSVDDHGKYVFADYIGDLPTIDDHQLIPELRRIVDTRDVAAIYPAMDAVVTKLKSHEGDLGCAVIASCTSTTEICLSKSRTYAALRHTIRVPQLYQTLDEASYPAFAKPDIGYGSRGAYVAHTPKELAPAIEDPTMLALEYLPGKEYTVDCFSDESGLKWALARSRDRIKSGISVHTQAVKNQREFEVFAQAIHAALDLRGAWFFQVKRDGAGDLCLLEVAARLGGSSSISRALGVNLALASIFEALGTHVSFCPNAYDVALDRSLGTTFSIALDYTRVYVDYDDCLVYEDGTVNIELLTFLYQCINRGVELNLLSKHSGPLMEELVEHRLSDIFDNVIHLKDGQAKAAYINIEGAIFIDDSFTERKAVADGLGIPTFAPDMISCLLDFRR